MIQPYSNRVTSFGINNEGQLTFTYSHEDTDQLDDANVYNGQNSVLWTNFRQAYADEIKETYQNLRNNDLITYDKLVDRFITNGSDKWSESIYNEDMDFKYISMLRSDNDATNLPQVRGSGEEHFRYFVENRLNYCDSKWYASDYANDYISLRIYTPTTWSGVEPNPTITVTPFSNMYAGVRYKANGTLYQERVAHGVPVSFSPQGETFESENNESFNDTETAIYGAHQLSSIGDLAPLYCGSVNVANADKLIELKVGDGTTGYSNANLRELSVGTNKLLKKIDVRNCPNFASVLDLSNCPAIEEVYATGTSITGINFPESGVLRIAKLPATLANFTLKHQLYVEDLTIAGYDAIKTLWVENCPNVDGFDILSKAVNVDRVRLTDVDLTYNTAAEMLALAARTIGGIDENGTNVDKMWIDGKCHIKALTGDELRQVNEAFPYLTITYDALTSYLTFMSEDGNTQLAKVPVQNGGNATYTGSTPTKASTAQYTYTFAGWSLTPGGSVNSDALKNVEADRTVYAAFSSTVRTYTVRFYSGTTLLQTVNNVPYGGTATYTGSTPTNNSTGNTSDFQFYGWSPSPSDIKGNTDCYAQFNDMREIKEDWSYIKSKVNAGTANYGVGAFKTLDIGVVQLPMDCYRTHAISYNGRLHIIAGTTRDGSSGLWDHYSWDGVSTTWVNYSKLPQSCKDGCFVVYNNEIHRLGGYNGYTTHNKWNGSSWVTVSTLPYEVSETNAVVYNNEIHILGGNRSGCGTNHYKWDGSSWTSVGALSFEVRSQRAKVVIYNDEIHILGSSTAEYSMAHHKWDGSSWVEVSTLPFGLYHSMALVHDNEIHLLNGLVIGGNSIGNGCHYKWNGAEWISVSTLPYSLSDGGTAVLHNDVLYLIGGRYDPNTKNLYQFDFETSTWSKVGLTDSIPMQLVAKNHDDLPDGVCKLEALATNLTKTPQYGCAVTYQNEVHVLGGQDTLKQHLKWDATTSKWITVSTLPYNLRSGSAVVYNNEIHILSSYSTADKTEHYKWNATDGWVSVSTLPHQSPMCAAVVYNNEIHIIGSYESSYRKSHYKWDGTEWTSASTLPYDFYFGSAVVHNNEIHILSTNASSSYYKSHYKWDGTSWTSVSTLPYNFYYGSSLIIDNEIHIFGGSGDKKAHYRWDGTEWISVSTLPYDLIGYPAAMSDDTPYIFINNSCYKILTAKTGWGSLGSLPYDFYSGAAVLYKNEIHILGGSSTSLQKKHYKWDGSTWIEVSTLPYTFTNRPSAVVLNDEIHILGTGTTGRETSHYKWDGSSWTYVSTLPYKFYRGGALVINGEIHIFGSYATSQEKKHYKWNGEEWISASTLPYTFYDGEVVVYKDEIHLLGGTYYGPTYHRKWNGSSWTVVGSLPYDFNYGAAVVYNDEIHIMGSQKSSYMKQHYKYDGTSWTKDQDLPHDCYMTRALVYNNSIVLLGSYVSGYYTSFMTTQTIRPKATLTFIAKKLLSDRRVMNTSATNAGGWSATELRAWLNGDFIPTLPSDLQTALTEVRKLSDDGGSGNAKIEVSHDKIWILSVSEITTDSSEDYVSGQGSVYSVFTDDNSRIRTPSNDIAGEWWTRSSKITSTQRFVNVTAYGSVSATGASNTKYILIGFCI